MIRFRLQEEHDTPGKEFSLTIEREGSIHLEYLTREEVLTLLAELNYKL